jgi:hypothetical protein
MDVFMNGLIWTKLMVRLCIEFLESKLNSYSICEFQGKKMCKKYYFLMVGNDWKFKKLCIMISTVKSCVE